MAVLTRNGAGDVDRRRVGPTRGAGGGTGVGLVLVVVACGDDRPPDYPNVHAVARALNDGGIKCVLEDTTLSEVSSARPGVAPVRDPPSDRRVLDVRGERGRGATGNRGSV
jgi:hypothetical protein